MRSNKELIEIALRTESVTLTKDEAIQFITEHRDITAQHAAGVEFMVKGYGAQDVGDEEMYVGGQDADDIDNFLENNLADYDEFQLWAMSYCTNVVNEQTCLQRNLLDASSICQNCSKRLRLILPSLGPLPADDTDMPSGLSNAIDRLAEVVEGGKKLDNDEMTALLADVLAELRTTAEMYQ